jgi:mannose-6-phosphate isomerase-like protein (cupin superfamily)
VPVRADGNRPIDTKEKSMLPIRWVSRDELLSDYVAQYSRLTSSTTGLPDSEIEGHEKAILNVFGFEPPEGAESVNPVGDAVGPIAPKAGFSVGFIRCLPHNGPVLHNHNSNETFIPLTGRWRFIWESSPAHEEFIDLDPYDTVSFPPGVPRRFENLIPAPSLDDGLMLAIVAGDAPISEAMPGVKQMLMEIATGKLPMIAGDPDQLPLLTTTDGGFGG